MNGYRHQKDNSLQSYYSLIYFLLLATYHRQSAIYTQQVANVQLKYANKHFKICNEWASKSFFDTSLSPIAKSFVWYWWLGYH